MKAADLTGGSVTLKLKTGEFRQVTRSRKLGTPTQAADAIFHAVMPLLEREATGHGLPPDRRRLRRPDADRTGPIRPTCWTRNA